MGKTGIPYLASRGSNGEIVPGKTWSPTVGCTPASTKCRSCWSEALHTQRHEALLAGKHLPAQYAMPFYAVRTMPERLAQPLHWRKPQVIGVSFTSDLFHEAIPANYVAAIFGIMAAASWHKFVVLTSRAERMRDVLRGLPRVHENSADAETSFRPQTLACTRAALRYMCEDALAHKALLAPDNELRLLAGAYQEWPLSNVMLCVSAEDQEWAEKRIPALLDTPAARRGISVEPQLGAIDWEAPALWWSYCPNCGRAYSDPRDRNDCPDCGGSMGRGMRPCLSLINWVVVGAENAPDARPMEEEWVRVTRDACVSSRALFYYKQRRVGRKMEHAPLLDGKQHLALPWEE